MLAVDNINFNGKFRYLSAVPANIEETKFFDVGEKRVSKLLVDFSKKSKILNKLKEDKDVMLFHFRHINKHKPERKGLFSRFFSADKNKPETETEKMGNDYLSIIFANNKPKNPKDTEYCALRITLPINKNSLDNLDRFEKVLKNNSDINVLKAVANRLFPKDTHKVTPFFNPEHGFCEFWTGKRSLNSTLDKLLLISKIRIKSIYEQVNKNIINKTLG